MTSKWVLGAMIVALGAGLGAVAGNQQEAGTSDVAVAARVVGDWELGPYVTDVSTTVGSAGGEVVVASGELAGLRMEFPAGAAADGTAVTIEHAPILRQTWGSIIDPATPAIRVTVGDGSYLADAVTVSVPVVLAGEQMAMGLFVGEGGELEGMPVLGAADDGSLGVVTRHFSEWFVSRYLPAGLPDQIFTGYQLARDNWSFINYGSYLSPGGHCAGMSISSMWFFVERVQDGVPSLYMLYDYPDGAPTPGFQHDDANGLRLASVIQNDIPWGSAGVAAYRSARYAAIDPWQFEAFRYSMYLTGEPQYVTLGAALAGGGGHAVVAYGVTTGTIAAANGGWHTGGDVWIADPNRPFALNSLVYDEVEGRFQPYRSGLKADGGALDFAYVGYAAKTALVDWNLVGQRFAEADAGTIGTPGTVGVRSFPDVVVYQWVVDPTSGNGSWIVASAPTVDASGTATIIVELASGNSGQRVLAKVMTDGGTSALQASDVIRGGVVVRSATLAPGTYKLVVWAGFGGGAAQSLAWVDAFPLTVAAAPLPTTTVPSLTVPPTIPATTTPPTMPPSPTMAPPPAIPCSECPPGLAGIDCRLHCEQI